MELFTLQILYGDIITEKTKISCYNSNEGFKKVLQTLCNNDKYLSVPTLKLKLYDLVQNCFKDGIIEGRMNFKSIFNDKEGC